MYFTWLVFDDGNVKQQEPYEDQHEMIHNNVRKMRIAFSFKSFNNC